ncbi:MAG: pentapeptide repeat-containing protein [Firmicutes bacterium]|nr:pentapeptide repeat-containing protein [Bacillota bacterium]
MQNALLLRFLNQGASAWNSWRQDNSEVTPDLSGANLGGADLCEADLTEVDLREADLSRAVLRDANLSGANLTGSDLREADLSGADLTRADLTGVEAANTVFERAKLVAARLASARLVKADLAGASLRGADLGGADLTRADLSEVDLSWADLSGADLTKADLTRADLRNTNLTNARFIETTIEKTALCGSLVHRMLIWGLKGDPGDQSDLIMTPPGEPTIAVDGVELSQLVRQLLDGHSLAKLVEVDPNTSKAVLVTGRFEKRKPVLEAIRQKLRSRGYSPILFDFGKSGDLQETIPVLACLCRFVIADITDSADVAEEQKTVIAALPVPVQPIMDRSANVWGVFAELSDCPRVLVPYKYESPGDLRQVMEERVIPLAERMPADRRSPPRARGVESLQEESKHVIIRGAPQMSKDSFDAYYLEQRFTKMDERVAGISEENRQLREEIRQLHDALRNTAEEIKGDLARLQRESGDPIRSLNAQMGILRIWNWVATALVFLLLVVTLFALATR